MFLHFATNFEEYPPAQQLWTEGLLLVRQLGMEDPESGALQYPEDRFAHWRSQSAPFDRKGPAGGMALDVDLQGDVEQSE